MKAKQTFNKEILKYGIPALVVAIMFILGNSLSNIWYKNTKLDPATETPASVVNTKYLQQQMNSGIALGKQGNADAAINLYNKILKEQQNFAFVHMNLGRILFNQKKYKESVNQFKKALEIKPNYATALAFLGMTLRQIDKPTAAIEHLKKAIQITPKYSDAHLQLSKAYYDLNMFDEALKYGYRAAKLSPKNVHTFLNLGHIYNKTGKLSFAVKMYKKALAVQPNLANAHYNLGYTLKILGQRDESLASLNKALELQPDYVDAHLAKAQVLISMENFEEGLEEFEWRWGIFGIDSMKYKKSMWDGSDIKGKTIVLRSEQGLGDTMQYIRYAKVLKEKGATVICKVQKPLVKLLSYCPYIDKLITKFDQAGKYDAHAQLMSLPRILKTTPQTIPADIPYLQADKVLVEHWKKELEKDKNFKVGFCWHVDPVHEKTKSPWSLRSISLESFAPLAKVEGISFYSLQKLKGTKQIVTTPEGFNLNSFGPDFDESHGSFMDSAAIIKNLDLVITVDTCIAHLAGALNKPVWMMLPFAPDCRWYLEKPDTPWYPTMTMFRQPKAGDWKTVIQNVTNALSEHVKKYKQS